MAKEKPLLDLIDISSYIYRAYHAIRGLTNSKGFPTNAAFGVTNMLLKVLRERQPQYLALAFDAKGPTFRHREYAEYKAHRPPMPEELAMQLPYIHQIIKGLNLPALIQEGYEADDLICTLVHRAKEQGFQVEIISGDKDLLPLVQEGVTMWDPMKDVRYDPEAIKEKYGLTPEELVDVRALAGDPSDNIPGVPGIGEKTALKLIAKYHSLENLLAHVEEIKEKALKSRLREFADQARLSKKLTLLECGVPLDADPASLQPGPWDREALRRLFVELEFSKFNKELGFEAPQAGTFLLAQHLEDLDRVAAGIRESGTMALFFVLGEQHPVLARVAGLGLAWREGEGAYIPFTPQLPPQTVWEKLGPLWTDGRIAKVGADLKGCMLASGRYAPEPAGISGDVLLASYLLNPVRYEQNLENVALHYLGVNLPGPRELAGRPVAAADLAPELACRYGGERAETALRLWPLLQADLKKEGLWKLYSGLELPLLAVLAHVEEIKEKALKSRLREFADQARLSKKLTLL
ncbi:MAG: DNA polymerase I, partial [Deltaproteobacteria bacterium]|nr:DNA polymerase I [Deltaproteobacteria bacterium]